MNQTRRHSRLGVAACLLGILVPVALTVWGAFPGFDPAAGYALCQMLVMWALMLTPAALAILGLLQRQSRKLFPLIGLILSLTPIIFSVSLVL